RGAAEVPRGGGGPPGGGVCVPPAAGRGGGGRGGRARGGGGGGPRPRPVRSRLALGAPDHALDEPVHCVELLDGQLLALLDAELALLVVERALELVELAADEALLLGRDQPLRLRGYLRAERRKRDQAVLDAPVV